MYPPHVVVADPNLRKLGGHYLENALETVRALKRIAPRIKILALTGPQEGDLKRALDAEPSLEHHAAAFTGPRPENLGKSRELLKEAWRASTALGTILKEFGILRAHESIPVLFTDLSLFELLIVAFLRLRHPTLQIISSGIVRSPATTTAGRLSRKYDFLMRRAKPFWRLATSRTQFWTDSLYVQNFIETELSLPARLAPICVAGVWERDVRPTESLAVRRPMKVAFVGDPTTRRGFDLYVMAAAAMHEERHNEKISFTASVTPPRFGKALPNSQKLMAMLGKGAELHEGELPGSQFAAAIDGADIVWAVGDPQFYGSLGTSGIYTHAMCLAKRVISNAGSWAERITPPIRTARFIQFNLDEAVAALRDLADEPADDASRAEVERWQKFHSRHAFDEFTAARLVFEPRQTY